jgi:nicotinate-nucleotide adenylyltransferase
MRPLWFGGSFNPIHFGHLVCARAVAEAGGFDRVVLIPSSQPPHKSGDTSLASASARVEMCRLAVAGDPFFAVDDLELARAGRSYTIDTVRQLRSGGWPEISWLIGADMAKSLPTWHKPTELLAEVRFVLMARPGWSMDWKQLPQEMQKLQSAVIPAPLLEISSTDIRQRLAAGRSIRYMTPHSVIDYIRRHKLYEHPQRSVP